MTKTQKTSFLGSLVKVGTGVIVGAGAGFLAGLILAPKSGKETLEDVKSVSLKLRTDASEKVLDIKERGGEMVRRGTSTLKIGKDCDDEVSVETLPITKDVKVKVEKERSTTESLLERIQGVTAENLE
ncbi:hypothetical protein AwErysi_09380 [Erysipelotrichaceae bacterium]|nr:hypothetical protein AwErysi_09380 [Erysipelotrichaceae bacterium]